MELELIELLKYCDAYIKAFDELSDTEQTALSPNYKENKKSIGYLANLLKDAYLPRFGASTEFTNFIKLILLV